MASSNTPIPRTPFRVAEAESEAVSTLRTTKRKLDDAFQTLDNAVSSPEIQRPPPLRKSHTIRSLYSTLAKYGIAGKEEPEPCPQAIEATLPTTKSTPHLSAILARAAKRTRKALSSKFSSSVAPLAPTADYRPSSLPAFLARLSTFKLSTYANKPPTIDAVAAAKCGWINEGKDRLVCGLCRASWVIAGRDGLSKDAANGLLEKQRGSLVDAHKDGCPWKIRQCDPTIYCISLQSPAIMVKDIKINATTLDPFLRNITIKHPLTSTQITSLRSTLSSAETSSDTCSLSFNQNITSLDQNNDNVFLNPGDEISGPSDAAILTTLFGWSLAPTVPPDPSQRPSLARANSLSLSTLRSRSRSSSVHQILPRTAASSSVQQGQQGAPTTPSHVPSAQFTFHIPSNVDVKRDTILHCTFCQRRIGLWAFSPEPTNNVESRSNSTAPGTVELTGTVEPTPNSTSVLATSSKKLKTQRPFDVLKEHRAYCPYVVRSTIVPTFPVPISSGAAASVSASSPSLHRSSSIASVNSQSTTLEGWRAVLTVVLRYGVVQRQRLGLDFVDRLRGDTSNSDESMEVDGVKAMIAGVKKRGGKELLQYVKGLLG